MTRTMTRMTGTGDLAHLSPRQDEMTHLWEAKASRRNHTELSRLQRIIIMVFIVMNIEMLTGRIKISAGVFRERQKLRLSSIKFESVSQPHLLDDYHFRYFSIYSTKNKTKWPRQVHELILDSNSEILDFWSFDEKNNGEIFCIFCI